MFEVDGYYSKGHKSLPISKKSTLKKYPISFSQYQVAFNKIQEQIKKGNTYLANLTFSTKIETNLNLYEIFLNSSAKFKLYFKDQFVCFSPERFIKIKDNKIYTYPMKGTIDALITNAKEKILNNQKELAEHIMVVDLLRNDINMVAKDTKVDEFRFVSEVNTTCSTLLQVSSKISGVLQDNWQERVGDILFTMLPAGSISGTPKIKTVEILKDVELHNRGFFTGVFGYYKDGILDSGVMIRFIQKDGNNLIFKSGGGITSDSDAKSEYQEMIDKVYI